MLRGVPAGDREEGLNYCSHVQIIKSQQILVCQVYTNLGRSCLFALLMLIPCVVAVCLSSVRSVHPIAFTHMLIRPMLPDTASSICTCSILSGHARRCTKYIGPVILYTPCASDLGSLLVLIPHTSTFNSSMHPSPLGIDQAM